MRVASTAFSVGRGWPVDPLGQLAGPELDQEAALDRAVLAAGWPKPLHGVLVGVDDQELLLDPVGGVER
jgi:hypothetical protein